MGAHPGLPFPADWLHGELWVADVVYRPLETELLRAARAAGCRTLDGGRMAVFQAAEAFELFISGALPGGRTQPALCAYSSITCPGQQIRLLDARPAPVPS